MPLDHCFPFYTFAVSSQRQIIHTHGYHHIAKS